MEEIRSKRCTKCGEVKPFSEFHNAKSFKDGKAYICKACSKKRRRENYLKNRDKNLEVIRQYALEHSEQIAEYQKQYKIDNHDRLSANGFVYRASIAERRSSSQKADRRSDPKTYLIRGAKKRSKELGIPFSIENPDILVPDVCPIFGIPLIIGDGKTHDGSPSLDRIVPLLGYIPNNVAVMSRKANVLKGDGTAQEHRLIADWMDGKSSILSPNMDTDSAHIRTLLTCARSRAKQGNLPFSLTKEDIVIPILCPVLGIPIARGKGKYQDSSPTLDKRIANIGYVPENVAIISWRANRIKNVGTSEEHRKIADWMDSFLLKKAA